MNIIYRLHAIERMFQRDITEDEVEYVLRNGDIIENYDQDKPYPSMLVLGFTRDLPLHVVYAKDEDENFIVITVYRPSVTKWENDFRTRRSVNAVHNL